MEFSDEKCTALRAPSRDSMILHYAYVGLTLSLVKLAWVYIAGISDNFEF